MLLIIFLRRAYGNFSRKRRYRNMYIIYKYEDLCFRLCYNDYNPSIPVFRSKSFLRSSTSKLEILVRSQNADDILPKT